MVKKVRVPACYEQFHCVAAACSDSCCAGWQVDVDAVSWKRYQKEEGEFGEYLHSVMVDVPGEEGQFRLREDGRCPFLNLSGLCDMYDKLGEKSLCDTCTNYPRFMEDYGELREVGIAFSCPEASRLILSTSEPMQFLEGKVSDKGEQSFVSDVMWRTANMGIEDTVFSDEEGEYIIHSEAFDREYFQMLFNLRKTAFCMVQNRRFSMADRVLLYLDFGMCVQDAFDREAEESLNELMDWYKDEQRLLSRLQRLRKEAEYLGAGLDGLGEKVSGLAEEPDSYQEISSGFELYGERIPKGELRYRLLPEYIAVLYQDLKHCKPFWGILLSDAEKVLHKEMTAEQYHDIYRAYDSDMSQREYEYEHWLSYFVFKYFLKSYFDDDIYGKVQLAVMAYLVVKELAVCQWVKQDREFTKENQIELFHLYSRELEHSDDNYDMFEDLLHTENMCNGEHLRAILLEWVEF